MSLDCGKLSYLLFASRLTSIKGSSQSRVSVQANILSWQFIRAGSCLVSERQIWKKTIQYFKQIQRYKSMNTSELRRQSLAIVKPCWNHLTSNLGLINVKCGSPFPRFRLGTNKRARADYPGLLEKQIKRSVVTLCQNCVNVQFNSAEIRGVASFSSGQTSDPIPEEPRPGERDGQLLSKLKREDQVAWGSV